MWQKATIEHDGHVIGGADYLSVLPGDFVVPSETTTQPPITIKLGSLELFAEDSSSTRTPAGSTNETSLTEIAELRSIQTYSAMLRFTINDGDEREIHVGTCLAPLHLALIKFPSPFQIWICAIRIDHANPSSSSHTRRSFCDRTPLHRIRK